MNFTAPKAELISENDPFKKIELAARTCYKSENKISEGSAEKMVRNLIKSQHTAMLEHAVVCFELLPDDPSMTIHHRARTQYAHLLKTFPYLHLTISPICDAEYTTCKTRYLVSGNLRAISERGINDPIFRAVQEKYPGLVWGDGVGNEYKMFPEVVAKIVDIDSIEDLTTEEIGEHKNLTFRFFTDRGVANEIVRHRPCSFAQVSTRYVNYLDGIAISEPADFISKLFIVQSIYEEAFEAAERAYSKLIQMGEKPQQARAVLPLGLQTEIVVTTNMKEWKHIFNLRVHGTTGAPHPDIKIVMQQALDIAMQDQNAAKYLNR